MDHRLAIALVGALSLTGLGAVPARAAPAPPTYTCEKLTSRKTAEGRPFLEGTACLPSNGAPTAVGASLPKPVTVRDKSHRIALVCEDAGTSVRDEKGDPYRHIAVTHRPKSCWLNGFTD
ncbi:MULTISPECIES: hypothetical protein [Actinomadura]|uniref:Secreted protein n=1 Tax=Actinomadura yumaensis TaxID=111807 RepID=A0ABW2CDY1_9ACTN|nr:hypothetical protein [Actinomadura sp. J1-007]MWK35615.1 hypothetical protein [Actinomadura sp. J1-007]